MNPSDAESTAVQQATDSPDGTPEGERELVRRFEQEDVAAQKLEDRYRKDWCRQRDYVAGTQQTTYTVQTNVIAPKLNSVLPYIYARDPEPDCRPSEAVDAASYDDVKAFTETAQIIVKREWGRNRRQLKRAAKRMVRSAQTVSLGYFKAAMCTDTARDPLMAERYNTLQDNLTRIDSMIAEDQVGDTPDDLARKREQIILQMQLVRSGSERQVVKGQLIEPVRADDILVCPSVRELQDYASAPWIRQNIYMPAAQAMAMFKLTKEQVGKAKVYRMRGEKNDATPVEVEGATAGKDVSEIDWVCVRERWSLEDGYVYQWLAGCHYWLSVPAAPQFPTERFYPFFQLGYNWVDDRRYPNSDVANMMALQDEYSARRSAARTWRERSKPGLVINGQAMSVDDTKRMTTNEIQEHIVLQDLDPSVPLPNVVMARPIPQMDMAMLDTGDIMRELEMLSGAQDAATGSIQTAKTATEAEIMQHGNQAKGGEKVDTLDDLDAFQQVMDINVLGMVKTFQPFIAAMRSARHGTLVGLASVAGFRGLPGAGAYSASKAAAIAYLASLRVELHDSGVKVATICPGYIETPMTAINPYPMPFMLKADEAARRMARAIERQPAFTVIPWQMGLVGRLLGLLPRWLYDRLFAHAPHKPRSLT